MPIIVIAISGMQYYSNAVLVSIHNPRLSNWESLIMIQISGPE